MARKIIMTGDGSPSIEWEAGVTYHSMHGAVQESRHIFIGAGLEEAIRARGEESGMREAIGAKQGETLHVFELGLGTGLNALLTLEAAQVSGQPIFYACVEAFPLEKDLIAGLDYCEQLGQPALQPYFAQLHTADWEAAVQMTPWFTFYKSRSLWPGYQLRYPADVVYYDAFDPVFQPELWSAAVFDDLYKQMASGAILVTYCSKGVVRRSLEAVGFLVEKLPGPPGKREIIRARKR